MAKSNDVNDALARLASAEDRFLTSEFLAPAVKGGQIHVRIAGVVCRLNVSPADFEGWGVFRPVSHSAAQLVRNARLAERQRYLELFPSVRLILALRQDGQWLAVPAHKGDRRFHFDGLVPVRFVEEAQLFEVVQCRFDGSQFWYDQSDPRWDPGTGAYLRTELERLTHPNELSRSGLTAEEREAYAISFRPRYERSEEARRDREERRVRQALEHAGADMKGLVERSDVYTVTYEVDGQRHVSAISKNDLSVQVAGICLSGEDSKFDLQSLVGVIREAQGGVGYVPIGRENGGMTEEQYWNVHPPE